MMVPQSLGSQTFSAHSSIPEDPDGQPALATCPEGRSQRARDRADVHVLSL